jgi:hypothetical protein
LWAIWLESPDFPLDDAYIIQHAIDGLRIGRETRFIDSHPMDGITSPVHVALVWLVSWAVSPSWAQVLVAVFAWVAFAVGVSRLAVQSGVSPLWASVLAVAAAFNGPSLFHFANGLETGLAMAAGIWALNVFIDPLPTRPWQASILGVLPFIRPELAALSLFLLFRAAYEIRETPTAHPISMKLIVWSAVGTLPFVFFILVHGGSLLPRTSIAKAEFFAESCATADVRLGLALRGIRIFLIGLGFFALGFVGLVWSRFRWVALGFLLLFLYAYVTKLPGGLFHNWFRYAYPLIPLIVAGWIAALNSPKPSIALASKALLLIGILYSAMSFGDSYSLYRYRLDLARNDLAGVTQWLEDHVTDGSTILVHDAGFVSIRGTQPLIDLVGIKTRASTSIHASLTAPMCRRNPAAIDAIARLGPARFFVVFDEWDSNFRLTDSLRLMGWGVQRADQSRGSSVYKIYSITPPERAPH